MYTIRAAPSMLAHLWTLRMILEDLLLVPPGEQQFLMSSHQRLTLGPGIHESRSTLRLPGTAFLLLRRPAKSVQERALLREKRSQGIDYSSIISVFSQSRSLGSWLIGSLMALAPC